ncbi:hypothetical protein [Sulfoacidibacillus thermotolerans]|uniref:Uncharacterized protein n=1 Tax=Sulfoacidibacillus thermotolerans TaxID=1765684 RepID=A0A2U3D9R7_SULT2|nr:hypothetical protein [Sulfoacidibacillus thermotolerans]PWI58030.1 hypothetical protein BM613_04975 [Sulfoacidibacillus thermotolerans]
MKKYLFGTTAALVLTGGIAMLGSSAVFAATKPTVSSAPSMHDVGPNVQYQFGSELKYGRGDHESTASELPETENNQLTKERSATTGDLGPNLQVQSGSQNTSGTDNNTLDSGQQE